MATTTKREDYLGRDLVTPASASKDSLGRVTTSTADHLGRLLRRDLRVNSTVVALNQELQFAAGTKYTVTVAGTTAVAEPSIPAVNATVADGTATLRRTK
jgi:hypothetical protein